MHSDDTCHAHLPENDAHGDYYCELPPGHYAGHRDGSVLWHDVDHKRCCGFGRTDGLGWTG